jgi:serine/threonine protein phosphatase PrpC
VRRAGTRRARIQLSHSTSHGGSNVTTTSGRPAGRGLSTDQRFNHLIGFTMTPQGVWLKVFGRSDVGVVRVKNEDAFVVADLMVSRPIHAMPQPLTLQIGIRGVLLAVSDGMGGAQAGEIASALTLHSLRVEMPAGEGGSVEAALTASVQKANQRVWETAANTGRRGMGATLTAVLVHGSRAYVAEVGDSRAYVLRGSRFVQLTHDQSYVQTLLDAGALRHEDAEYSQFKNVIMQAIGTEPSVVVALNRFTLRRGDRILLCSDGLTSKVKDDEIRSQLAAASDLSAACTQLIELANSRGGEDNVTVVLAEMDGDGLPAYTGEERVSLETIQAFPA